MKALQCVSAFASTNELGLAQVMVDKKSNEIEAVPQLLDLIDCKITVDALNCQKKIVEKVREKEADYLFAVKKNHRELYEEIVSRFENQNIANEQKIQDFGHGRIETRICKTISNLTFLDSAQEWKSMKSIVKIDTERVQKKTGEVQKETRYYITSLETNAQLINHSVRSHWSVENKLHWMIDVHYREDNTTKSRTNAIINQGVLNKLALYVVKKNWIKDKKTYKMKKFLASISSAHREEVMGLS